MIRSNFVGVQHYSNVSPEHLLVVPAIRASNNLFDSDFTSVSEMAKRIFNPNFQNHPLCSGLDELTETNAILKAFCKLNSGLRSNLRPIDKFSTGDLVEA